MNEIQLYKSKLSAEELNWQQQVQQFLLKGEYDQISSLCEQAIEIAPNNLTSYCYLCLTYLLQGKEEEAQTTWLLANISQEASEEKAENLTEEFIAILDAEAQRQANILNLQTSWIIRRYIQEIAPSFINNLLNLIQLSIELDKFTPDIFREWKVGELLRQNSLTRVNSKLLLQVFAHTTELYLDLDQKHLEVLKHLPRFYTNIQYQQTILKELNQFTHPYKLNLGCGKVKFNDWINVDIDETLDTVDMIWDVSNGLPFEDDSCQIIYHEHMLEHLPVEKGVFLLRECRRVLQTGGVLRIAMPSLDILLKKACSDNWREQDWLTWPEFQFIKTRSEMINISFRWWGHQWLYDREELNRRLNETGFTDIEYVEWGCSDIKELKNRETRNDSLLICEARK